MKRETAENIRVFRVGAPAWRPARSGPSLAASSGGSRKMKTIALVCPLVALGCVAAAEPAEAPKTETVDSKFDDSSSALASGSYYVTTRTVEGLATDGVFDLSGVKPAAERTFAGDPLPIDAYLRPMSALGY